MSKLTCVFVTFLIVFACPINCDAYKGLFVMTFGTKSHMNFFGAVSKALAQSGHEITLISTYQNNLKEPNIKEIYLTNNTVETIFGNLFSTSTLEIFMTSVKHIPRLCANGLTQPEVVEALKEKYDYIILSLFISDCFLGYVYENKIPLIYASPNVLLSPYGSRLGAPHFTSITPNKYTKLTFPLSFMERTLNILIELALSSVTDYAASRIEAYCREHNQWLPNTPSVFVLQNQASLAIINSVRALEIPVKSVPPTVIYAGGIHIQEPKPLPKDLENWLQDSGDAGFILFSLGTGAKPEDMKEEHLQSILNVFRTLDQRIIWKWSAKDMKNVPSNVKLSPWLPQQDILAHPKIRLFITHGGLFSTQEATYFGVPILGMPIFADQMSNVAEIEAEGWGRQLAWSDVNEETFRLGILDAMTNTSILQEVLRRSELMKDWPTNPSEEVVYWVEYVARHKGAKHLQSPLVHMTWYEIYNFDAWLGILTTVIVILFTVIYLMKYCFKLCFRLLFRKKHKRE